MKFVETTLNSFTEVLSSKAPVPGGGGASALVGAVGIALGDMVGSLTVGKKKYANVEADIFKIKDEALQLRSELLRLVDKDAEDFEPLSRAYSIPKDDPNRAEIMENALKTACEVPLEIMRVCAKSIDVIQEFAEKGSSMAVSDAGVGVIFCKAAIQGAVLNIYINTKSMTDKIYAKKLEAEAEVILAKYLPMADTIYNNVLNKLK